MAVLSYWASPKAEADYVEMLRREDGILPRELHNSYLAPTQIPARRIYDYYSSVNLVCFYGSF